MRHPVELSDPARLRRRGHHRRPQDGRARAQPRVRRSPPRRRSGRAARRRHQGGACRRLHVLGLMVTFVRGVRRELGGPQSRCPAERRPLALRAQASKRSYDHKYNALAPVNSNLRRERSVLLRPCPVARCSAGHAWLRSTIILESIWSLAFGRVLRGSSFTLRNGGGFGGFVECHS